MPAAKKPAAKKPAAKKPAAKPPVDPAVNAPTDDPKDTGKVTLPQENPPTSVPTHAEPELQISDADVAALTNGAGVPQDALDIGKLGAS